MLGWLVKVLGGGSLGAQPLRETHLGLWALDQHTEVEFGSSSSPSGVLQALVSYSQSSGDSCRLGPPCRVLRAASSRGYSRSMWTEWWHPLGCSSWLGHLHQGLSGVMRGALPSFPNLAWESFKLLSGNYSEVLLPAL